MLMKDLIKDKLEIIISLEPQIENNVAIKFIFGKIMSGEKREVFEVPINYIDSISLLLKENNIKHKIENNNEYVSNIIKL
ncbi:hypothetical protein ACTOJ1_000636 [Shigella flexneri]